ncbi:MAG: glycosyltransferase family 2 protein [Pseudomonadota bacterium]
MPPASSTPMSLPKVAVLTPVYNGEAYLRETLESVQAQTYANLVHVVVNNACTDGTADILADFEDARVPVIVIHHKTLLPQMENWNSAFSGMPEDTAWFRLLCADDTMQPAAIERMVACGEQDPDIGFVGCKRDINGLVQDPLWPTDRDIFDGAEALRRFFENQGMIMGPHLLVRTAVLEAGTPFYDLVENAADTDAALRVLTHLKMGFVHEHLAFTRVHDATVTQLEASPLRKYLFDWYLFLARYGEAAFGAEGGRQMKQRYRRHYLRRLVRSRREDARGDDIWAFHKASMERIGEPFGPADYLHAALDRGMIKAGMRDDWFAYPW